MESKSDKIAISQYISVAISTAEASGRIIRQVLESGQLEQKQKKGPEDPVTIADLKVQKTIEETFSHFFPNLKTHGEESQASMEGLNSCIKPTSIDDGFIKMD